MIGILCTKDRASERARFNIISIQFQKLFAGCLKQKRGCAKNCQARKLIREDAMDRSSWRMLIKDG